MLKATARIASENWIYGLLKYGICTSKLYVVVEILLHDFFISILFPSIKFLAGQKFDTPLRRHCMAHHHEHWPCMICVDIVNVLKYCSSVRKRGICACNLQDNERSAHAARRREQQQQKAKEEERRRPKIMEAQDTFLQSLLKHQTCFRKTTMATVAVFCLDSCIRCRASPVDNSREMVYVGSLLQNRNHRPARRRR